MAWQKLFGEMATTKIAAVFNSEAQALNIAHALQLATGLQTTQIRLVEPYENDYDKKLEPEPQGIARTALRSHLILGIVGLVVGGLLWYAMYANEWPTIRSAPRMSAVAILFFTTMGGMMLGGLVTARPDHQIVIERVRDATQAGNWALVIHPRDPDQCNAALEFFSASDIDISRTV